MLFEPPIDTLPRYRGSVANRAWYPLHRAPALIWEGCAHLTGGVCIKLLTKLRHNLGECLEEPLGPPGRWISAGWWCPPKLPVNPPIRRETLARSVCQGLLFTGWSCRM